MRNKTFGITLLFLSLMLAVSSPAFAVVIFDDNFNAENGGVGVLNYNSFAKWSVSDGTVDLIGNGFYDFLPGNGLYVDMDGSTSNAGIMTSALTLAPGEYTLQFDLAGNHRNGATETVIVDVTFGSLLEKTYSLSQNSPFTTFTETFTVSTATSATLSFTGVGGDNIGMLLDNVKLSSVSVPEYSSFLLLPLGLAAVGWMRRRWGSRN
jgi:hypothetical protein